MLFWYSKNTRKNHKKKNIWLFPATIDSIHYKSKRFFQVDIDWNDYSFNINLYS